MAKQIRISAKLDKSSFQKELNQLLKKGYDLNLNGGNFKSVVSEISKELNKLKSTLNNVNGNTFDNATSGINKTKDAVKDLNSELTRMSNKNLSSTSKITDKNGLSEINKYRDGIAQTTNEIIKNGQVTKRVVTENISQFENLKAQLQNKLLTAKNNSFIDSSVINKLQAKLNSLNTNSSVKNVKELQTAINNLSSNDSGIVRLQQSIIRLEERIKKVKNNKLDVITPNELSELKQAEFELEKLRATLSSLKSGEIINAKAISSQINTANNSVRTLETSMKNLNTTGSSLAITFKNIFSYALGGSGIYLVLNSIREAINTTISLDDSLRDLKRVTDLTSAEYEKFMHQANQTAIALGTTTAGAIDATTTFAQLGYSFNEASEYMSKMAMVLSNVGNMSASDAASSLVSILKGFRLEAKETTKVVDVLNEAGNKFALTTGDLTEGLRIGGASLALANNDLEEASSLIIAGTEILRDSNMVSNGLKTISMRIKGLADENGELALGLENTVKILTGVDLKDPNNEFRSTFDILKDIGEVWDDLSDVDKATLAEDIAGKHRVIIAPYVQKCA
ncbi:phage tail tape measure protein [uncultured Clostridium sp.]|uniref:phage tail tape measure protein n=1 Tax=uncultured Clostridium sp. TaxID=59620 RepID=UPI002601C155|nr:phage tail tape measure protein [uncultured Clostridium sp.]